MNIRDITKEEAEELDRFPGTDWEGLESSCCGAPIIGCDICSDCREHCEPACFDDEYFVEY